MEDKVWAKINQCRFGHLRNWAKKLKKTLRTTTIVHHIHGGPAGTALVPKPATGTIELSTFITAIRTSTRAAPVGGLFHFITSGGGGSPEPFEYSVLSRALDISNLDGTIDLGSSWSSAIGALSPKARPADRSTFCPMPGGRFQAASDAIRTEAVSLDPQNRKLGRCWNQSGCKKRLQASGESPRVRKVIWTHALQQTTKFTDRAGEQEMRHCEPLNWPE